MESKHGIALTELAKRVVARMEELGISQSEVARRGRFNRVFISDLVRGRKKSIHSSNYNRLARALLTTPDYLRDGNPPSPEEAARLAALGQFPGADDAADETPPPSELSPEDAEALSNFEPPPSPSEWKPSYRFERPPRKIHAYRSGGRLDGAAIIDGFPLDEFPMPSESWLEDLYAVAMADETMVPRYEPGDYVYARKSNAKAFFEPQARPKDYVVIMVKGRSGHKSVTLAFVRQLLRKTDHDVIVRQLKPSIETRFAPSNVVSIDRIVLSGDAIGEPWR